MGTMLKYTNPPKKRKNAIKCTTLKAYGPLHLHATCTQTHRHGTLFFYLANLPSRELLRLSQIRLQCRRHRTSATQCKCAPPYRPGPRAPVHWDVVMMGNGNEVNSRYSTRHPFRLSCDFASHPASRHIQRNRKTRCRSSHVLRGTPVAELDIPHGQIVCTFQSSRLDVSFFFPVVSTVSQFFLQIAPTYPKHMSNVSTRYPVSQCTFDCCGQFFPILVDGDVYQLPN